MEEPLVEEMLVEEEVRTAPEIHSTFAIDRAFEV